MPFSCLVSCLFFTRHSLRMTERALKKNAVRCEFPKLRERGFLQGISRGTRPVWDGTVWLGSSQTGFFLPPVVLGTGNAHLLASYLLWEREGREARVGFMHVCGGMGVERDANGMGRE